MSKKNRDARREPVAHLPVKTRTLPAEIETVRSSVGVTAPTPPQDEPAPVSAPLTLRERAPRPAPSSRQQWPGTDTATRSAL